MPISCISIMIINITIIITRNVSITMALLQNTVATLNARETSAERANHFRDY